MVVPACLCRQCCPYRRGLSVGSPREVSGPALCRVVHGLGPGGGAGFVDFVPEVGVGFGEGRCGGSGRGAPGRQGPGGGFGLFRGVSFGGQADNPVPGVQSSGAAGCPAPVDQVGTVGDQYVARVEIGVEEAVPGEEGGVCGGVDVRGEALRRCPQAHADGWGDAAEAVEEVGDEGQVGGSGPVVGVAGVQMLEGDHVPAILVRYYEKQGFTVVREREYNGNTITALQRAAEHLDDVFPTGS
jgi:hypothetical protein